MTTEDLVQVQLDTGLSNNGMEKLASTINQVAKSRIVEPNFRAKFQLKSKLLSDFFTQATISSQPENSTEETENLVVHCKSLEELIDEVLLSRKVFSDHLIKVGIDGCGGFLKVCLGIIEIGQREDVSSPPSKLLLTQRIAKDSGVKQQLIVAIAEELPENYLNVKHVWSLMQSNSSKFIISCDLKLANIMCGLQNHASSHPCTRSDVDSRCLSSCGSLRTLGSLMNCYQAFKQSGVMACINDYNSKHL